MLQRPWPSLRSTLRDFPRKNDPASSRSCASFCPVGNQSTVDSEEWCRGTELNCRHQPFQGCALPTELPRHGSGVGRAKHCYRIVRKKSSCIVCLVDLVHLVSFIQPKIRQTKQTKQTNQAVAEREGFEPSVEVSPYGSLANCCLRPLGHLSTGLSFMRGSQSSATQVDDSSPDYS